MEAPTPPPTAQEPSSGAGESLIEQAVAMVVRLNPTLEKAPAGSVEAAIKQALTLGLDPSGIGGFARIVLRYGRVALTLGYTGMVKLAMQSGDLVHLDARTVFDKDTFALDYAQQILQHAPYAGEDGSGAITGAYAVSGSSQGFRQMQFVSGAQIKAASERLWTDGMTAEEICRKVALMALLDVSPLSLAQLRHALDFERRATA